jgi:hypothetical protein
MRSPWLMPLLLALALCPLSGCRNTSRIEVAPYRQPCVGGELQMLCMLTREEGSSVQPTLFYEHIEGFSPRWGHRYTIEVETLVRPGTPPADGTRARHLLLRVLHEEPVADGTPFTFVTYDVGPGWARFVDVMGEREGRLLDGTPFTCTDAAVCSELKVLIEDKARVELTFSFRMTETMSLVLQSVARVR